MKTSNVCLIKQNSQQTVLHYMKVPFFYLFFYYFFLLLLSADYSFSKLPFSKTSFRNTVRLSNSLDLDQVGADLGPNFLHSKKIDQDLHCLFDKAEFTTNCSTLNESSIFLFFFLLFFVIFVMC